MSIPGVCASLLAALLLLLVYCAGSIYLITAIHRSRNGELQTIGDLAVQVHRSQVDNQWFWRGWHWQPCDVYVGLYWKHERFNDADWHSFYICFVPYLPLLLQRRTGIAQIPVADAQIDPTCAECGYRLSKHPVYMGAQLQYKCGGVYV